MSYYWRKEGAKVLHVESLKGQKAACQREHCGEKKKTLTLGSKFYRCRRCCCCCWWGCRWVRTRHANHKSMWQWQVCLSPDNTVYMKIYMKIKYAGRGFFYGCFGLKSLFKGTVSPDFWPLFFFFKQLLLAPVGKPSDDFDFFRIFAEIFNFSGASPVSVTPAKQTILL